MSACAAFGCTNRPSKKIPGVTFHRFPKNEDLRAAWVKALKRKNWQPSNYSRLCSEHFIEEVIDRTSLAVVRLRENAVPTLFKAFPSSLEKETKQRKPAAHTGAGNLPVHTNVGFSSAKPTAILDQSYDPCTVKCDVSISSDSAVPCTSVDAAHALLLLALSRVPG